MTGILPDSPTSEATAAAGFHEALGKARTSQVIGCDIV
jgi:hypothetical protein